VTADRGDLPARRIVWQVCISFINLPSIEGAGVPLSSVLSA
jgi:hypothetical protein